METYIALLRGINVGGKNKISMTELRTVFEESGFKDVVTYINSGNIIFKSYNNNELELKSQCEISIKDRFDLDIPVTIISAVDLSNAMQNAPAWWDNNSLSKNNVIFVIQPVIAKELIEQIGVAKPEYEQVSYHGQVIFWSAPLKTYSRTRWSKIAGKPAYKSITIRNANTTKKLLQLIE